MLKLFLMVGWLGIVPGFMTFAQVASGSPDLAPWITGGSVLTVSGILYKVMTAEINRLQLEVGRLQSRLESIADDDRKTIVPVLVRATEVLSNFADAPRKD